MISFHTKSLGNVGIGTTAPDSILALNAATGDIHTSINKSNRSFGYLRFEQGGLSRWDIGVSSDNETGSNAGSNFFINMKSDAGDAGATTRIMTILRNSGNVGIGTTATGLKKAP